MTTTQALVTSSLIISVFLLVLALVCLGVFWYTKISKTMKDKHKKSAKNENYKKHLNDFAVALSNCLFRLSLQKIGAVIIISRNDELSKYLVNGYGLNVRFSPEFAINVFANKKSAFHDGAMIIEDFEIVCISSYLPMTNKIVDVKYGARHRAAIGMSEENDSVCIVVSETTGDVSHAINGKLSLFSKNQEDMIKEVIWLLTPVE